MGWRKLATVILLGVGLLLLVGVPAQAQTWNLVWNDEFDSINTSNWTFEVGGGGWGNNELQYYTNGNNSYIQNGVLVIEARRESVGGMAYTSSRMITRGKREFTYGKIEARMAIPMGQGIWPAFWMLGTNIGSVGWPACGETDIMEHINATNTIYGTIHWDTNGYASYGGSTNTTPASYHVYTIEWTSSAIKWFVDGVQYHEANILNSVNGTDEFHRPFFIILNQAVGGNWPGSPNSGTPFPSRFYVDYVRVYQQGTTPPPPPHRRPPASRRRPGTASSTRTATCAWTTAPGARRMGPCSSSGPAGPPSTTSSGSSRRRAAATTTIKVRYAPSLVIDVSGVSTANGAKLHLWTYVGGNNQQWIPEQTSTGVYRFRARHSGRCIDVPGSSTARWLAAPAVRLQRHERAELPAGPALS